MMNILKACITQSRNIFKKQITFYLSVCFFLIATGSLKAQCPDYGPRKQVASSFHSTVIVDSLGLVRYWGDAIDQSGSGANVPSPLTLTGYTGTPVALAAGSQGTGNHQHYLLTTTNLYGWGYSANTIVNATVGAVALTNMAFPAGVTAATTNFIEAANGGLALVTSTGEVWIKAGAGSVCAPSAYGDGSAALNTAWHHVTTSAAGNPFLTGVSRLSFSGNSVMALTTTGTVYVWGLNTYLGNGSAVVATRNRATLVTNPALVTPADVNIIADGALNSSQFILGTNGNLYAVGENNAGQLGQNNTTDLTTWTAVRDETGAGVLSNIIQLASNNPYNFSRYSVGALRDDNIVFLWGFNDQNMAGAPAGNVLLPRVPDNYGISGAKVSYLEMGGHTSLTFLLGTNKFCYIGHKIRGSMGDGTIGTSSVPSFDCYNTPGEYICPGPTKFCVNPSSNDLVACANHASTLINDFPSFTYWGEHTSSYLTPGLDELDPQNLFEYNGTPRGVAAGSVGGTLEASNTQMWALTDEGLWGWGYSANTISNATLGNVVNTAVALPGGVTIAQVSFIRASRGGIALVTTTGEVWVKAGAGSNCSFNVYGDGSAALNTAWHHVTTSAVGNPFLTGVTDLSFGGTAVLAVTPAGTYVWGDNTFLGDGTAAATRNRAALMPAISGVTANKVEIIQAGALNAAQFILGNNGKVYAVGENKDGVLGQNNTTDLTTWTTVKNPTNTGDLVSISKLSSNNPYAFDSYSIGALTIGGTLYLWGDNNTSRLGGVAANYSLPRIPPTLTAGSIANFDIGGHFTIAFRKASSIFCFVGHQINGSLGDNTATTATISTADCASTPVIAQCAGTAFNISGTVYNDNDMLNDNLVDGSLTSSAGASPLYAILLDNSGFVLESVAISGGTYSFVGYPAGSYSVQISTTAGIVGNTAPAIGLPSGWIPGGEQLGIVPGVGIDLPADGAIALTISTGNITDANFGIVYPEPVAVNDTISTPEDTPVTFSLSANDTDVDSNLVASSVTLLGTPPLSQGTVTNNGDGTITFNPAPNFNGVVTPFDYQICDASGLCDTATVYITVTPVNDLPLADADDASVPEDGSVTVPVLVNDTFGGDGPSTGTITIVTPPTNGTASVDDGGTPNDPTDDQIIYTPDNGYYGNDNVVYQICDSNGDCDTAIIRIIVIPGTPIPDTIILTPACPSCPVTACATADDIDTTGGGVSYSTCGTPSGYDMAGPTSTGCYTFTPTAVHTINDTTCIIACKNGKCDTTYVIITPPIKPDTIILTPACPSCPVTACATADDIDTTGGGVSYSTCGTPSGYDMAGPTSTGCYTFTPTAVHTINDTTCIVACKDGKCDTTYVIITPPIKPDTIIVTPTCTICPVTACVTADDIDTTGGGISYSTCGAPSGYDITGPTPTGCYTFIPTSLNTTNDTTCIVACKDGKCDTTYVIIIPPVIPNDTILDITPVKDSVTICTFLPADTANLEITSCDGSTSGTTSLGTWSINPLTKCLEYVAGPIKSNDTICVKVCNSIGTCEETIIIITITGFPPVAVDDNTTTDPGTPVTISILGNDTTFDEDPLTLCDPAVITQPTHGTVVVNQDGTITYTPTTGYSGVDSLQYQICDPEGTDTAWVYITVEGCIFPNAFSPNGDGINDVFEIPCLEGDVEFCVYNRWGIEVYRSMGYLNNWDGTYKGSPLPDGTYYYALKYTTGNGQEIKKAGYITLHR